MHFLFACSSLFDTGPSAWCGHRSKDWIEVDLRSRIVVAGIGLQGWVGGWVTQIRLEFRNESDAKASRQQTTMLQGNDDSSSIRIVHSAAVLTRYVRLEVLAFSKAPCLRLELYFRLRCPLTSFNPADWPSEWQMPTPLAATQQESPSVSVRRHIARHRPIPSELVVYLAAYATFHRQSIRMASPEQPIDVVVYHSEPGNKRGIGAKLKMIASALLVAILTQRVFFICSEYPTDFGEIFASHLQWNCQTLKELMQRGAATRSPGRQFVFSYTEPEKLRSNTETITCHDISQELNSTPFTVFIGSQNLLPFLHMNPFYYDLELMRLLRLDGTGLIPFS